MVRQIIKKCTKIIPATTPKIWRSLNASMKIPENPTVFWCLSGHDFQCLLCSKGALENLNSQNGLSDEKCECFFSLKFPLYKFQTGFSAQIHNSSFLSHWFYRHTNFHHLQACFPMLSIRQMHGNSTTFNSGIFISLSLGMHLLRAGKVTTTSNFPWCRRVLQLCDNYVCSIEFIPYQ